MAQPAISLKGAAWRGRTTLATNDRGDRRMVSIDNGYVSMDGHEIRAFPGFRRLIDLSDDNNPTGGYNRYIIDAVRPVMVEPSPLEFYGSLYQGNTSAVQTMRVRAKPRSFEWFKQLGGVLTIGGTTRFREAPVMDSSRNVLTIASCSCVQDSDIFRFFVRMSGTPAGYTTTDASGAGMNGVTAGDVFYIEGLVVSNNAALQTAIDAKVNGRFHLLSSISSNDLRFNVDMGSVIGGAGPHTVTAGTIHKVRPNRTDLYSTPNADDPYDSNPEQRIDDWNALTTWRITPTLGLSISNCASHTVYPAYVANRRRDFADEQSSFIEGILIGGGVRGVSRREQKELPYRMVPEAAGDRIIIAVPGYNLLFQQPLMVPLNPDNWPNTPALDGLGVRWFGNDTFDIPRSLGLPKCRLIDSPFTPAPTSPGETEQNADVTHWITAITASPGISFPAGTYRLCCTYYDSVTGDEGAPSEIVEFRIPSDSGTNLSYVVNVSYMLPGYIMPECLADKLNVYMTDTDGEALGFYKQVDLKHRTGTTDYLGLLLEQSSSFSPQDMTSKYGPDAGFSPDNPTRAREWNTLRLPLAHSVGDSIDFTRPPINIGMPRGASVARSIRGFLLAGGSLGTEGTTGMLYPGYGSLGLQSDNFKQIIIRQHRSTSLATVEDGTLDSGFGVASRNFPDAYQGLQALNKDLLPDTMGRDFQVSFVENRLSTMRTTDVSQMDAINFERLSTVRPVLDSDYRESPSATSAPFLSVDNKGFWWEMPKGVLQIGEPGQPSRVTKAGGIGIQVIDYNKDDDITAIYQLAGNAVICSKKETYFLSWGSSPIGQQPSLVHSAYGCIAPNSMVEFDGGVAWISEQGPVAIGASLQFIGQDIQEDFVGSTRRYLADSRGMMRHAWGCHDRTRGLILWGMVTTASTLTDRTGEDALFTNSDDGDRSRCPCDEVLIWSYRTNSFSRWRPPTGMGLMWMEEIAMNDESVQGQVDGISGMSMTRLCGLTSDGVIYAFDDDWSEHNQSCMKTTATAKGSASTSLVVSATAWSTDGVANGGPAGRAASAGDSTTNSGFIVVPGQRVEGLDENDQVVWSTEVASADPATNTIVLATAQTWAKNQAIRVGARRPVVVETTAIGAEFGLTGEVSGVQMRYTLFGSSGGTAQAKVEVLTTGLDIDQDTLLFTSENTYEALGTGGGRRAQRRKFQGKATSPEVAVRITVTGEPQVRIADLALEVA